MWFRCTVVALGLCSLGRAQEIGDGDEFEWKPIVLTDETFDASVKEGFWLLVFYAVSNLRRTAFFFAILSPELVEHLDRAIYVHARDVMFISCIA